MYLAISFFLALALCLQTTSALALEEEKELVRAAQNPLKTNHFAEHLAAPFENDSNFGYGPYNNAQNILNFKPVVPFRLNPSYDLIIRTIAPLFERTVTADVQKVINGNDIKRERLYFL